MKTRASVGLVGALLAGGAATAAEPPSDRCAALSYMLAQARTEFPNLAHRRLDFGNCAMEKQEFECVWVFPTYAYPAAEDQASKLAECTAAERGARPLEGKRGEVQFQVNPETSVAIRGPDAAAGNWKLMLRIVSTADWE